MAKKFLTDINIAAGVYDSSGDIGNSGQVLSSTGSGVNWINATSSASIIYQDGFTGDGSTTAFTLANSLDNENKTQVYIDGVYQHKDNYSLSGTTLTFSSAPPNNSDIEVISFSSVSAADDILYDDDFTSAGLMTTDGSGVYSITTNNSSNWNTAYTHSQAAHAPANAEQNVQSDWTATSGDSFIQNKPATFTPSQHTQLWSTITSTPTTLAGYGITDTIPSGNQIIDWTADQGSTEIHSGNYINTTYTVGDGGLTQNNFTNALKTKLDGIETSADVTDTANVTAAGALMDSELTDLAGVKAVTISDLATETYVDTAVSDLVDSSPATLNTLNELAAALGDDANFSTTVTNSIATKLPLAGGTLTGDLTLDDGSGASPKLILKNANDDTWSIFHGAQGVFNIREGTTDRLEFAAGGNATFTGTITASGYNDSNWNTAYGWGDHGAAGYITGYTETDTLATVTARGASTSTAVSFTGNMTAKNTKFLGGNSYNENIRMHPGSNDYSSLILGAVSGDSGTGAGQWSLVRFPNADSNKFTIRHNSIDHVTITTSGNVTNHVDTRSPIFYDSNNTVYYLNPASTSVLNRVEIDDDLDVRAQTGTWITSNIMSDAIGWNSSYGVYIGSNVGGTHYLRGNGTFTTGGSTYNLWHEGNDTSFVKYRGSLTSQDWNTYIDGTEAGYNGVVNHSGSNRPPAYTYGIALNMAVSGEAKAQLYFPETGSSSNGIYVRTGWNTSYRDWRSIALHNVNPQTGGSLYANTFYDSNNTGYYLNPYGQSKIRNNNAQEALIIEGDYPQLTIRSTSVPDASIHFDAGFSKKFNIGPGAGGAEEDEFGFAIYSGPRGTHYGTPFRISAATGYVQVGDQDHPAYPLDILGTAYSSADFRAPIFYDSNNTGYFYHGDSGASLAGQMNIHGGTGSTYGNQLIVGQSSIALPYTLQDSNLRPIIAATGAYPVLHLNHTANTNTNHGPTIQFTHNGVTDDRQWVIGSTGDGISLDIGFSSDNYESPNAYNPHNGISGYRGKTWMRFRENGNIGLGASNGGWGGISGGNPAYAIDTKGTLHNNTDVRAPIFYDSGNTGYYINADSTSNLYNLELSGSKHTYLYVTPGAGYEAMIRFNGAQGSTWYVGKRTTTQLLGSQDACHFYSQTAGQTVGGYSSAGHHYALISSRALIFYDNNNTGYYTDPASTSILNALQFSYTQHGSANNIRMGNSTTMNAISSGSNNAAFGVEALGGCSTGSRNFAYGYAALFNLSSGGNNIAMGDATGYNITSGSNNLLFGQNAGRTGYQSPQSIAGITTGSNQIHMGNESHSTARIQISWTVNSDARDKTDVTPINVGLDFVKDLNPVTFRWDKRSDYEDRTPTGENKLEELTLGFLAQEVETVEKSYGYDVANKTNLVVDRDVENDGFGLTYEKMIPILTKAIQELEARVQELENN